jgi:hypothetical protein
MKSFKRTLKLYTYCIFDPEYNETQPLSFTAHGYCLDKLSNGKVWGIEGVSPIVEQLLCVVAGRDSGWADFANLSRKFYFNKCKEKVVWL